MRNKDKRTADPIVIPSLEALEQERVRLSDQTRYHKALRSTVAILVVVAALAVLVATLWMPVLRIYGRSMNPTLDDGQIVVTVKTEHIQTGDIVAFYHGNKLLIKRCLAGPGDWVDIAEDGTLSVNGTELDEPYLKQKAFGDTTIDLPYQVPDERYFMVGDNREVSLDSRSASVGCIETDQIVGKVVFRVWPFRQFGPVL